MTFFDYFSMLVRSGKLNLNNGLLYFTSGGFFQRGDKEDGKRIIVFLNDIKKLKEIEQSLPRLLHVCYHEARHAIQSTLPKDSYAGFLINLEFGGKHYSNNDYKVEHDLYFVEIDANQYAIKMTKKYLQDNYPEIYEREKEKLLRLEQEFELRGLIYDPSETIDRLIKQIRNRGENIIDLSINMGLFNVIGTFMNSDNTFKNISEIIQSKETLDPKIINAFVTTNTFLNSFDFDSLSNVEEIEFLEQIWTEAKMRNESQREANIQLSKNKKEIFLERL